MSTNNYILNLLNIKDTNIHILTENISDKTIKGKNYKIIEAILTYNPEYCPCCGCVNESHKDIIKWGFRRNCIVKIPKVSNCLTRLILHKQRFLCKNCNNTFIAETDLVNKFKSILTIKSTKLVASGMNAISYGFYTIVVQQLVGLPTGIVVTVTIITNMIGVYLSMLILDKVKKDMLWKITVTTPSENLKSIAAQLDEADIGYTYYVATKKKGVMEIYSETSKQSLIIRNILKNYKYKYCITEGQHSL